MDKDSITLEEQKKTLNELVKERSSEFRDLEKRINRDNSIYKYKSEEISPKDFRNHQNLIKLFEDLKDGNINPNEILKNQLKFKSDLGKIKKENPKSRSKDQISVIQSVDNFFLFKRKIINFFTDYYFLPSEARYRAKHITQNSKY